VRRAALVFLAGIAALAGGAQSAHATNECRGLQVCVPVHGPWVVVPAARSVPRPRVDFQLSCPPGFIVGGLDAQLSDRAIDVDFPGRLGSPVGPGVTTSRSALFRGTYIGSSPRGPTFRPHIGCVPASGGGPGPVPFRRPDAVFPPSERTVRRVRTVRIRPGNVRALAACAAGERLISGWHAVAFYTSSPPSTLVVASVVATRTLRAGRVDVRARAGAAVLGVRAVVQVGALCGSAE
jgi:hypothetical protein